MAASDTLEDKEKPTANKELQTGNPALTVQKRKEYGAYNVDAQVNGDKTEPWPQWLESNGYGLDKSGHVYKKK